MRFTQCLVVVVVAFTSGTAQALNYSGPIWVDEVPTYVRPYAIQHYSAGGCVVGSQIYRFPVTGPSSGNAFTLMSTNAPGSDSLGVLPHLHQVHYENMFSFRGRFQLWTEKDGDQETRILTQGDYGAIPQNTTHTFQFLDPDTEMLGVVQPGGFEDLFYALSSSNYSSSTSSPYNPLASTNSSSPNSTVISSLESFDVYAELDFSQRTDAVNGAAPANSTWRTGPNTLPSNAYTPYYVAKDYGPMYLSTEGGYQVIQPLVTPTTSGGNFTISTITMDRLSRNVTVCDQSFTGHAAFEVLEGQLTVLMGGEVLKLLQGDVVFIPEKTTYKYYSLVAYTKVMLISQGAEGLDTKLIANATSWSSPVWPTS
ncbi:Quercetin 2,3-dioxygenase [Lachnellula willkommii]|uniref:Quercetin 2,3-dioxygenase n=1 Tax=Lachnellula willkommii TaxID=215461 RepID=A0A559LZW7_9HELO|nr:Quercetin 2,3-dioxygenase [Lachnellula willkommii]